MTPVSWSASYLLREPFGISMTATISMDRWYGSGPSGSASLRLQPRRADHTTPGVDPHCRAQLDHVVDPAEAPLQALGQVATVGVEDRRAIRRGAAACRPLALDPGQGRSGVPRAGEGMHGAEPHAEHGADAESAGDVEGDRGDSTAAADGPEALERSHQIDPRRRLPHGADRLRRRRYRRRRLGTGEHATTVTVLRGSGI